MKKPDLIKQLANRINQPHVIESWINKIETAAYNKGLKDAGIKQCNITDVSNLVRQELERRVDLILSEPDGIVRETMIKNIPLDL